MSILRVVFLPLVSLGAVIFVWFWVKPMFVEARNIVKTEQVTLENKIKEEKELQRRTSNLFEEQDKISNQANAIINALPVDEEIKNLLAQIEFVVQKEQMSLKGVTAEIGNINSDSGSLEDVSNKGYKSVECSLEVGGNYNQFKQLLQSFEKLDRLVNVTGVSVSSNSSSVGGDGSLGGLFSIKMKAYYQDQITPEKIKNVLEAGENPIPPAI